MCSPVTADVGVDMVMPSTVTPGERTPATVVPRATSDGILQGPRPSESFCESAASLLLEVMRWAALWRKTSSPRDSAAKDAAGYGPPPRAAVFGHVCVQRSRCPGPSSPRVLQAHLRRRPGPGR